MSRLSTAILAILTLTLIHPVQARTLNGSGSSFVFLVMSLDPGL